MRKRGRDVFLYRGRRAVDLVSSGCALTIRWTRSRPTDRPTCISTGRDRCNIIRTPTPVGPSPVLVHRVWLCIHMLIQIYTHVTVRIFLLWKVSNVNIIRYKDTADRSRRRFPDRTAGTRLILNCSRNAATFYTV